MEASQPPATHILCKNCDTPLQGEYCHRCGQQDKRYLRSIFAVVGDLMGELGHWDSRFYRTLSGLFMRPGFLSLEFVRGRHASYVPPLRMYFFMSLISFMVMRALIDFTPQVNQDLSPEQQAEIQQQIDKADALLATQNEPASDVTVTPPDEEPATLNLDLKDFPLLDAEDEKLLEQKLKLMQQNPDAFIERLVGNAPQAMLLMLPFWALLLKLCYPFSKHYYIEHLAVALHTHAFLLLSFMMLTITDSSATWLSTLFDYPWIDELASYAENILLMWMVAYLLFTQKLFYQQSWPMTLFKFFICSFIYVFLIAAAFLALVVLGLLSS